MELELFELKKIMADCVELGAKRAMVALGELKPFMKLSEAKKTYGATTVNRWISEGLIKKKKDGTSNAMVRLDRMELEALAKASNRITYQSVIER